MTVPGSGNPTVDRASSGAGTNNVLRWPASDAGSKMIITDDFVFTPTVYANGIHDIDIASIVWRNVSTDASSTPDEFRSDASLGIDFTDPVALEETYGGFSELIEAMVTIPPPEIAADVALTAAGFSALTSELEAVDWDFLALDLAVLGELGPELEIASFNIEKYNFEVCGIDNGFDPADHPPLNPGGLDEDLPASGTIGDQAIAGLVAAGFTEEEATCIIENLDLSDPEALADSAGLLAVFETCGIPLERLAELGG